jgi:hypothetical protein
MAEKDAIAKQKIFFRVALMPVRLIARRGILNY